MRIVAVGLNHQAATLALRDQVAIGPGEMGEALEALRDRVGIGVILSTCNRSEVYTLASSVSQGEEQLKGFFTAYHQVPRREIEPHLYTYSQRKAVRHLFSGSRRAGLPDPGRGANTGPGAGRLRCGQP